MIYNAQRHLKIMFMMLVSIFLTIALINYLADPYDLYRWPKRDRLGMFKNKSYITKAVKIIQQRPDKVLLGTSTVEAGFALPGVWVAYEDRVFAERYHALENALSADGMFFNAGINGGTLYDIYAFLQHAYANNPKLRHVIVGLEWHQFTNERPPSGHVPETVMLNKTYVPIKFYLKNLFSLESLADAWLNIALQHKLTKNLNNIATKARLFCLRDEGASVIQPDGKSVFALKNIVGETPGLRNMLLASIYYLSSLYGDFNKEGEQVLLNPEAFVYLKKIVNFAHVHNIKLDVYITPQHAMHWITAEKFGLGTYVDLWLKKVNEITPYWDFSGRVDYSDKIDQYFGSDDRHHNYLAGEVVVTAIARQKDDPEHGVIYVTQKNFAQMIAARHQAQQRWLMKHQYFAAIFSNPNFANLRNLHGDLRQLLVHYKPLYHQYHIFQFMGIYIALPSQKAPYDFQKFVTFGYLEGLNEPKLDRLLKKVDEVDRV